MYVCLSVCVYIANFLFYADSLGIWMSWIVGTVFGVTCLALAKCMEAFVYVLMTPVRVAQDVHIKAVKLIVRLLENTPGGLNVLKAFNGYVSTNAASVAHDCKN